MWKRTDMWRGSSVKSATKAPRQPTKRSLGTTARWAKILEKYFFKISLTKIWITGCAKKGVQDALLQWLWQDSLPKVSDRIQKQVRIWEEVYHQLQKTLHKAKGDEISRYTNRSSDRAKSCQKLSGDNPFSCHLFVCVIWGINAGVC